MNPNDRTTNIVTATGSNRTRSLLQETTLGHMAGRRPVMDEDNDYDDFYDNGLDDTPDDDDRD